jgi:hypothetical protein
MSEGMLRSPRNEYRGVNAHLHSLLQNRAGEWESFHSAHIVDLARAIDANLPPGYFARVERSLQAPTLDLGEEDYLAAVIIYEADDAALGRPVTRLELLSPTNKPPGEGYLQYREKRAAALHSGLPLVELDYLHQTRPVLRALPVYPDAPNAYPYLLLVSDPRPSLAAGTLCTFGFAVDDPFPVVDIPLSGESNLPFDFGLPYARTFESTRYYQAVVDYGVLPLRFETYSAADRERVMARMATVADNRVAE